jgi:hypothetical protein
MFNAIHGIFYALVTSNFPFIIFDIMEEFKVCAVLASEMGRCYDAFCS